VVPLGVLMNMKKWNKVMRDCESLWNFPNSNGASDTKHALIRCAKGVVLNFINTRRATEGFLATIDKDYISMYGW
jgi:hypothetical protein